MTNSNPYERQMGIHSRAPNRCSDRAELGSERDMSEAQLRASGDNQRLRALDQLLEAKSETRNPK